MKIVNKFLFEMKIGNMDMSRYEKIYTKVDKAHDIHHILSVLKFAVILAEKYLPNQVELIKIAATLHDIGLIHGREDHELNGYRMILQDKYLKKYLTQKEIELIAESVKQHRASTGKPRTVFAKIISDADRGSATTKQTVSRAYNFAKHHNPKLSVDELLKIAIKHQVKKFCEGGYGRRTYFPETKKRLDEVYDPICKASDKNDLQYFKDLLGI